MTQKKPVYKYDFADVENKKIIEINGIFWHCKPELYDANFIHSIKKMTASEIWNFDKKKNDLAKKHGYEILIIWEDDIKKDFDNTINNCVEFIYGKNN